MDHIYYAAPGRFGAAQLSAEIIFAVQCGITKKDFTLVLEYFMFSIKYSKKVKSTILKFLGPWQDLLTVKNQQILERQKNTTWQNFS